MYRTLRPLLVVLTLFLAFPAVGRQSPNLAGIETATFLGGPGTEWFTSAAFPGDDSILIAGIGLDAEITLGGVQAKVLGEDAPKIKPFKGFELLGDTGTGKIDSPEMDDLKIQKGPGGDDPFKLEEPPTKEEIKKAQEAEKARLARVPRHFKFNIPKTVELQDTYTRLVGVEEQATGFVARYDASLKTVRALYRLPRGAGTIQDIVVGKDGAVYICGGATERISKLCKDRRLEKLSHIPKASEKAFPFGHVYVAKLSKDLSKVQWVRDIKAHSWIPRLTALQNGNVVMIGPSYLQYDPDGNLVQATYMHKKRVASGSAVDPVTGRFTEVGDWMSPTGREPWRCPRLIVNRPDGTTYKYLQGWRGPFFAPNHFHLVADSAVRRSAYDSEGNLYYSTWSHGGNNCMGREPFDPETHIPNAMNTTGSQTYAFIVKLGPEHNVKTATLWTSAGNVQTLDVAIDGSVVWAGRGNVTPDLPNTLSQARAELLCVSEPNLSSYRFISAMPAVGTRVAVGGCDERVDEWAFASGKVNGKPMLICLSGTMASEKTLQGKATPPLKNPVQAKFGGGFMDGYALLLDLTPKTKLEYDPPKKEKREPRPFKPYDGPRRLWPKEGQVWKIGTEKCVTVKVTFRDQEDKMWPSFFQGRGVAGGTFTYGKEKATANFTLDCPTILQVPGVQTQRVLGELVHVEEKVVDGRVQAVSGRAPKMKIHVTGMSPWKETGRMWGRNDFPVGETTISGILEFDGKKIPFENVPCSSSFSYPYRDETLKWPAPNYALPSARFTVLGEKLGLTGDLAKQQIRVHFAWEAVSDVKPEKTHGEAGPPPKLDGKQPGIDLGL